MIIKNNKIIIIIIKLNINMFCNFIVNIFYLFIISFIIKKWPSLKGR